MEKFYTVGQVSEIIHTSPAMVRKYLRDGLLKGLKMGGQRIWRVPESAIYDFLKEADESQEKKQ
jgi:predicted site-specific integrase-resolvase